MNELNCDQQQLSAVTVHRRAVLGVMRSLKLIHSALVQEASDELQCKAFVKSLLLPAIVGSLR